MPNAPPPALRSLGMTITTTTSFITYIGTGAQSVFTFPFVYGNADWIDVTYVDPAGVEYSVAPGEYTFTGNPVNASQLWGIGGSITYLRGGLMIPVGSRLTIRRTLPETQLYNFLAQQGFNPVNIERALDQLCMILQQIERDFIRDAQGERIINVGDPVAPTDAANVQWVEAFVNGVVNSSGTITPKMWELIGDGVTRVFSIATSDLIGPTSTFFAAIDGVLQRPTSDFVVDTAQETITFDVAPPSGSVISVRCFGYSIGVPSALPADGVYDQIIVAGSGTSWTIEPQAQGTLFGVPLGAGTSTPGVLTPVQANAILNPAAGNIALVPTKTALKAIDFNSIAFAYLTAAGSYGVYQWRTGDYTARLAADPRGAVYLQSDFALATVGCWVRDRAPRTLELEWFDVQGGAFDNYAAIQGAINLSFSELGGTIWCGGFYRTNTGIVQTGNDITWRGRDRSSGVDTPTAGKQLWKIVGARHAFNTFLINYPVFTSNNSDFALWLEDATQFSAQDLRVQGGWQPLVITGGGNADNTFINCDFIYPCGPSMNYIVNSTGSGVNGAQHFIRCRLNQPYPVQNPSSSTQFKGVRATGTSYFFGDLVSVGNYWLQCLTPGTSGAGVLAVNVWFGQPINDNGVIWYLTANTGLVGADIDTGATSIYYTGCDITGPFVSGFVTNHRFVGTAPREIYLNTNTVHGPLNNGVTFNYGQQLVVFQLDAYGAIFKNGVGLSSGIFVSGSCTDVQLELNTLQSFDVGIDFASNHTGATMNTVSGCSRGFRARAGTSNFRIINNTAAGTPLYGYNTTAIEIDPGASNNYTITGNSVAGAGSGVVDGGTGLNKTVSGNN